MTVFASLKDHVGRLVHPSASESSVEGVRHRTFIAIRIGLSCGALALAPVFLVTGGIPGWCDGLVLAWMVMPLLAAAHVSKTGQAGAGEVLSATSWIGLAVTAGLSRFCGFGTAAMILFLVPLEALQTPSRRDRAGLMATAAVALAGLLLLAKVDAPAVPALRGGDQMLAVFAFAYALALVWQGHLVREAEVGAARRQARRYKILSEAMGDLVLRFDRSGLVVASSGDAERVVGIPAPDLARRGFFDRVHVGDRPAFLHAVSRAATDAEQATVNLRFRRSGYARHEGDYVEPVFAWVEVRLRRLRDAGTEGEDGAAVVAAVRDITLRIQHEAEIERSKQEAEQASATKDRFIAIVSHELRTPLNAIIGFGEILANPALSPNDAAKRREYADIIRASGQHLLAVVNSLLDLSKLDAGKFELSCEPFAIGELVDLCCEMVRLKADETAIVLRREIEPGIEPLCGDKRACKQIILNLLSNALKFTPAGGRVTVATRPEGNAVLIAVSDTGIGMMPRDLAKLGDPFFQVRGDYDRPFEGTGLGLSVVKGLVGLHGGTIAVESAPGEGTRITVRLPLDGRRRDAAPASAKIEVIARYPRTASVGLEQKVQKIA